MVPNANGVPSPSLGIAYRTPRIQLGQGLSICSAALTSAAYVFTTTQQSAVVMQVYCPVEFIYGMFRAQPHLQVLRQLPKLWPISQAAM